MILILGSLVLPAAYTKTFNSRTKAKQYHIALPSPFQFHVWLAIVHQTQFKFFACTYKDIISILQLILDMDAENGFNDLQF